MSNKVKFSTYPVLAHSPQGPNKVIWWVLKEGEGVCVWSNNGRTGEYNSNLGNLLEIYEGKVSIIQTLPQLPKAKSEIVT